MGHKVVVFAKFNDDPGVHGFEIIILLTIDVSVSDDDSVLVTFGSLKVIVARCRKASPRATQLLKSCAGFQLEFIIVHLNKLRPVDYISITIEVINTKRLLGAICFVSSFQDRGDALCHTCRAILTKPVQRVEK